jgi:hypothetical protein
MFVVYDSTRAFFARLMMAKNSQVHGSDEKHSGYFQRLKQFALAGLKSILNRNHGSNRNVSDVFIYVRGDESSHFRERGSKRVRQKLSPA